MVTRAGKVTIRLIAHVTVDLAGIASEYGYDAPAWRTRQAREHIRGDVAEGLRALSYAHALSDIEVR